MKIAIVGAGAVGGVIAWHLARAGLKPVIVARAPTAALLASQGLTVATAQAEETFAITATSDPGSVGTCDVVLTGVKAHDLPAALPLIQPLVGTNTLVVPMLNGLPWWYFEGAQGPLAGRRIVSVDPDGLLAATLSARQIAGGVVYAGASRQTRTRITWNGVLRLVIGTPYDERASEAGDVARYLTATGVSAKAVPDIRSEVWQKLLGNTTYNPLSVVTGATIGRMARHPPLRRIVRHIMEEMVRVARELGVDRDFNLDGRLEIQPGMAHFRTSMLQDFDAGRPLELSSIVDAVVEVAGWLAIPMPMTETIGALARERAALTANRNPT